MSKALYSLGGLRFWDESEIELREMFQSRAVSVVKRSLISLNKAWTITRMEGPCLSPRDQISASYGDDDLFCTNHTAGGGQLYLRAETTPSSYAFARKLSAKLPLCVWQSGKSFRRETNDGASASKLRFNEFWQLEFQCIYAEDTKADYRAEVIAALCPELLRFTGRLPRTVPSDRLPSYSESTIDIELSLGEGKWREVASCSIRNDYLPGTKVCEIAIGLDRVVSLA